jgi:hypothetical protein
MTIDGADSMMSVTKRVTAANFEDAPNSAR